MVEIQNENLGVNPTNTAPQLSELNDKRILDPNTRLHQFLRFNKPKDKIILPEEKRVVEEGVLKFLDRSKEEAPGPLGKYPEVHLQVTRGGMIVESYIAIDLGENTFFKLRPLK